MKKMTKGTGKMPKGGLLFLMLEAIRTLACGTVELLDFMASGYGNAYRRFRGERGRSTPSPVLDRLFEGIQEEAIQEQRFYEALSRLKKDGLIQPTEKRRWKLTERGREKLRLLTELLSRNSVFAATPSSEWCMVTFDVPERVKRKREWLRTAWRTMEFTMLQRSVRRGKVAIPKSFLEALARQDLLECVEIFVVTRSGTTRRIA